jgi:hypothetical protein
MGNINVGTVTNVLSEKIRTSAITESKVDETRNMFQKFLDVINESKLLKTEFNVYNAMVSKHIDNDVIATRYIDNNIKLFETYTLKELEREREKISEFYDKNIVIDENKIKLYEAINVLITQSLLPSDDIDVDLLHESFSHVLSYVKTPLEKRKSVLDEGINLDKINEDIIEIAIRKFNDKYGILNEDDKNLLIRLIKSNDSEKKQLFEDFKSETLGLLEKIDDPDAQEKRDAVVKKINEMTYDKKIVNEQIVKLHELKLGLNSKE